MPPEVIPIITQWGPVALILFLGLYRMDQAVQALLPVVIKHFTRLDEGFDSMKAAVEVLAKMATRLDEMGEGLSDDHTTIAEDAKHAHLHARRAADGVDEILRLIPQRLTDKEVS